MEWKWCYSATLRFYYIAINIKWLKMCDKSRGFSLTISFDTLTRMPSHVAVARRCFRWRRTSMTSRKILSPAWVESDMLQTIENGTNIYSYIIKGLFHCTDIGEYCPSLGYLRTHAMTSRKILSPAWVESDMLQTIENGTKIYSYIIKGLFHCTDIGEYCPSLGYLRTHASSRPSISQFGTIFTNISAITL